MKERFSGLYWGRSLVAEPPTEGKNQTFGNHTQKKKAGLWIIRGGRAAEHDREGRCGG